MKKTRKKIYTIHVRPVNVLQPRSISVHGIVNLIKRETFSLASFCRLSENVYRNVHSLYTMNAIIVEAAVHVRYVCNSRFAFELKQKYSPQDYAFVGVRRQKNH